MRNERAVGFWFTNGEKSIAPCGRVWDVSLRCWRSVMTSVAPAESPARMIRDGSRDVVMWV